MLSSSDSLPLSVESVDRHWKCSNEMGGVLIIHYSVNFALGDQVICFQ